MTNLTQAPLTRKGSSREHGNATRFIPNNLPCLSVAAKASIVYQWKGGVPIRRISQNQRLTQPQCEAVIWEHFAMVPITPVTPTVRESRQVHLVLRRAA